MKKLLTIICVLICLSSSVVKAEEVSFKKCIDGDTADFIINNKVKKVRFLAIDTPETKHPTKGSQPYGKEASDFTCESLNEAKEITLEYENSKTDKYDRVLAWVFVDGDLLQGKLVRKGLAKVAYLYDDYKYTEKLQRLESEAKDDKLNIWSDYKEDYTQYFYLFISAIVVLVICIYDKNYRKRTIRKVKNKVKKSATKGIDKLLR